MKGFFPLFIENYNQALMTSNDLERIKYGVQRVEEGVFYNFKDNEMFTIDALSDLTITLIDADRVNSAKRYTDALKKEYEEGLLTLVKTISDDNALDEPEQPAPTLWDQVMKAVEDGDKKSFRGMRKDIKEKLSTYMNSDEVEDTILDLADAVADKDIELAKEVFSDLDGGVDVPAEPEVKNTSQELTEDEQEIIEDIKSAIDDGDEDDYKELIEELKELNPELAKQVEEKNKSAFTSSSEDDTAEKSVADEIIEDLEKAIADDDKEEIKELLEELKDEDEKLYKEWSAKVAPKKRERKRRGK